MPLAENLVIPGSTRNLTEGKAESAVHRWIPAFAGMTGYSTRFAILQPSG